MNFDTLLSKVKQTKAQTQEQVDLSSAASAKRILEENAAAVLFEVEGEEVAFYNANGAGLREKLSVLLADDNVQSLHFTDAATHLVHSRYGTMFVNIDHSASEVAKMLKGFEKKLNFFTTTAHGDNGLIISVEKPSTFESIVDLINSNAVSSEAAALLWAAIDSPFNANMVIVSPSAARFKVANALTAFVPARQRAACIGRHFVKHSKHWHQLEESEGVKKAAALGTDWLAADISNESEAKTAINAAQTGLKGIFTLSAHSLHSAWEYLQGIDENAANVVNFFVSVEKNHAGRKQIARIGQVSEVINGELRPLYRMENGQMVDKSIFGCEFFKKAISPSLTAREIENNLEAKKKTLTELNHAGLRSNVEVRRAATLS